MKLPLPPPPKCDLSKLIESHIKCIHSFLEPGTKGFTPTLLVELFDPFEDDETKRLGLDVLILDINIESTEEKHEMMEKLGEKYYQDKQLPIGIAFASEAWLSHTLHVMPRDADDRKEVLMIAAMSLQGESIMEQMVITRDKEGNIIEGPFVRLDKLKAEMYLLKRFFKGFIKGHDLFSPPNRYP